MRIVLASSSPRRRDLLAAAGVRFDVVVPNVDESPRRGETPASLVQRLAQEKAKNVWQSGVVVVAADTVVVLGEEILNKPTSKRNAREMLRALSGKTHQVFTGYCVLGESNPHIAVVSTELSFRHLHDDQIDAYVDSGEPMDKAGAYAIQGQGGALVDRIVGSYTNVIGLPLPEVLQALHQAGLP